MTPNQQRALACGILALQCALSHDEQIAYFRAATGAASVVDVQTLLANRAVGAWLAALREVQL